MNKNKQLNFAVYSVTMHSVPISNRQPAAFLRSYVHFYDFMLLGLRRSTLLRDGFLTRKNAVTRFSIPTREIILQCNGVVARRSMHANTVCGIN